MAMVDNELGELRRSSVIMTFAPGAVVDFRVENAAVSAVVAGLEFADACSVDIEADHRRALSAERDSDRQPDISKTDDGELATVRHDLPLMKPRCGPS